MSLPSLHRARTQSQSAPDVLTRAIIPAKTLAQMYLYLYVCVSVMCVCPVCVCPVCVCVCVCVCVRVHTVLLEL